jgi:hypothetical protein
MPDRILCIHCGKTGFVRREHIIQAGKAITAFYCGACNRSWQTGDQELKDPIKPQSGGDKPEK